MSSPEARYLEDRRKKQVYLSREIIEKGYDPDAFTDYCELLKSSDIDMWALTDLMDCVETFKLRNRPMENPPEVRPQSDSPEPMNVPPVVRVSSVMLPPVLPQQSDTTAEPASEPSLEEMKLEEAAQPSDSTPVSYPQIGETGMEEVKVSGHDGRNVYTIPGKLMGDNPISKTKNVRVTVENPELISGGFFSKSYIVYEVITYPFNWRIKRRFTEFEWLRGALSTAFPGYFIPPVPPRQPTNQLNQDFVIKRLRFLRKFMEALISTPIFARSQILYTFLKDQSMDDLRSFVSKIKKPERTEEISSVTPVLFCDADVTPDFGTRLNDFLGNNEAAKKKLKRMAETVTASFTTLSGNLTAYAEALQQLSDLQGVVPEGSSHAMIYASVSHTISKWAALEQGMGEAVNEFLNSFFKYRYNEMNAFKELLAERDRMLSVFQKAESRLSAKKDKLWQQGDVSKWELVNEVTCHIPEMMGNRQLALPQMLPKETQEVEKLKNIYAYYNNQLHEEFDRVMKYNARVESTHFGEMASTLDQKLIVFSQEWRELLGKLSVLQEPS